MGLQDCPAVVQGRAYEEDAAFCAFEVRDCGFEGVVGAEGVDFEDCFEGVGGEALKLC